MDRVTVRKAKLIHHSNQVFTSEAPIATKQGSGLRAGSQTMHFLLHLP
jgi:hypothetical protein